MGDLVYGCDICQDVCPWNRGVEKRRAGAAPPAGAEPTVDLVAWLEADGDELVGRYDRLYVPRNDPRWLRRNALVALGNSGGPEHASVLAVYAEGEDELLARARRAGRSTGSRSGMPADAAVASLPDVDRWIARVRAFAVLFAAVEVGVFTESYPSGYELWAWVVTGRVRRRLARTSLRESRGRPLARSLSAVALAFDIGVICAYGLARIPTNTAARRGSGSSSSWSRERSATGSRAVCSSRSCSCPILVGRRVVARRPVRPRRASSPIGHVPLRRLPAHGADLRLACRPAGPRDATRADAGRRGGAAARRARPPRRPARGGEPLRPCARPPRSSWTRPSTPSSVRWQASSPSTG